MMYSSSHKGFFPSDLEGKLPYIEAKTLPSDLVEMSDDDYLAWFNPPDGMVGLWIDGKPVLSDMPEIDYVAIAEADRERLLYEAQSATYSINLKLAMGRSLTDSEKVKANAWLDYTDTLNAIDLSTAPNIDWPVTPK